MFAWSPDRRERSVCANSENTPRLAGAAQYPFISWCSVRGACVASRSPAQCVRLRLCVYVFGEDGSVSSKLRPHALGKRFTKRSRIWGVCLGAQAKILKVPGESFSTSSLLTSTKPSPSLLEGKTRLSVYKMCRKKWSDCSWFVWSVWFLFWRNDHIAKV